MPLQPGAKLGPYEILALIGAGGMGEVHRARDKRLDRTVAVKVLPAHLADKPELRERFEREARAVSSLNHPRICTLYDVGEQDGVYFLVMEYVDGETLADRIARGPLPLNDSLKYAVEIADALDKAHRQGVVHRDLKPGNVMVTKAGTKLLDFGLAQLKRPEATSGFSSLSLPTNVTVLTGQGMILGTLQYMAPEQLEGKDTDARTDIFAFGALLYEIVTGRKAFEGQSQASLIAAILEREPKPISTQPTCPPELDRVIRRCLAKDPDERWQTAADLCAELKWVAEPPFEAEAVIDAARKGPAKRKHSATIWMVTAVAFFLSTAALAVALLRATRPPAEPDVVQFAVSAPDKTAFASGGMIGGTASASGSVSPDGRKLAFTAQDAGGRILLWIRSLDSPAARPFPGTNAATLPFWSPDSRWIGFFAEGKLKKIDIGGGSPQTVCDVASGRGGTWNRDGIIVYAPNNPGPLFRVSASGGSPVQLTKLMPSQTNHRLPHFLPDGKHFLFFAAGPTVNSVFIGSLDSTDPQPLLAADSAAVYAPSGYVLFVRLGTLFAQSFDAAALRLRGDPEPIADQVANDGLYRGFSVSENGVLAYRSGADAQNMQLAWFDRSGKLIDKIGVPGGYLGPNVSPDGKRIAVHRHDGAGGDIWIFEADRGVASRLTFDAGQDSSMPVWSPDGRRIVFGALRHDKWGLYVKQADSTNEETILETDVLKMPMSWTSDGKFIVYWVAEPQKGSDAWAVPMSGADRKPFPVLESPFNEQWPEVSPNGKWIAYTSDEAGSREIYIKPFPKGAGKWQVSANGGTFSRWRHDGKELYFMSAPNLGKMMAVDIRESGSSIQPGVPHPLFDSGYVNLNHNTNYHTYAVSPDGQRFLIRRPETIVTGDASPITVVLNWPALLKRK